MVNLNRFTCVATLISAATVGCSAADSKPTAAPATMQAPKPQTTSDAGPKVVPSGPQLVAPTNDAVPADAPAPAKDAPAPQPHTANYGSDTTPAKVPKVMLSMREDALCKLKVGDRMPQFDLPNLAGNGKTVISSLGGKKATVVVFWKSDRRMAREELADLGPDVIEPFGKDGVAVLGIVVNEPPASARETLNKAGAKFPNFLDPNGKAFAEVGSERLPRTFVLDASGKIVWFDLTYSLTTRRELNQAIRTLTGNAGTGNAGAK